MSFVRMVTVQLVSRTRALRRGDDAGELRPQLLSYDQTSNCCTRPMTFWRSAPLLYNPGYKKIFNLRGRVRRPSDVQFPTGGEACAGQARELRSGKSVNRNR